MTLKLSAVFIKLIFLLPNTGMLLLIKRLMMVLDLLNLQNVNVQDFEQKASNISAGSQGSRVH